MNYPAIPIRIYLSTAAALFALLGLTLAMSALHLGIIGLVIALGIAVTKAALVALYFMHLRYSRAIIPVFAFAGVLWLLIMIGGTLTDFISRGWLRSPEGMNATITNHHQVEHPTRRGAAHALQ